MSASRLSKQKSKSGSGTCRLRLTFECGVRRGTSPVAASSFYFPFGPIVHLAFNQQKAFRPGEKRLLTEQLAASGAMLLAVLEGSGLMGEGLVIREFNRI